MYYIERALEKCFTLIVLKYLSKPSKGRHAQRELICVHVSRCHRLRISRRSPAARAQIGDLLAEEECYIDTWKRDCHGPGWLKLQNSCPTYHTAWDLSSALLKSTALGTSPLGCYDYSDKCSLETTICFSGAVSLFLKDTLAFAHKIELLMFKKVKMRSKRVRDGERAKRKSERVWGGKWGVNKE